MATLTLASATCSPSLRLTTAAVAAKPRASLPFAGLLTFRPLLSATSLKLQTQGLLKQTLQARRWSCQAGSADKNDTVAAGEQQVSQVRASLSETEKQGPPVLTIIAGIIVAALVFWGLWSVSSAIIGIFIN